MWEGVRGRERAQNCNLEGEKMMDGIVPDSRDSLADDDHDSYIQCYLCVQP